MDDQPPVNSVFSLASLLASGRAISTLIGSNKGARRPSRLDAFADESLVEHLACHCCGVVPFHPLVPRRLSDCDDQLSGSPAPLLRSWSAAYAISRVIADAQQAGGLKKNDYPSRMIFEGLRHWLLRHAADVTEVPDDSELFHPDAPLLLQVLAGHFPEMDARRQREELPSLIDTHRGTAQRLMVEWAQEVERSNGGSAAGGSVAAFDPAEFPCACTPADTPEADSTLTSPLELDALEQALGADEGSEPDGLWTAMAGALLRIVWFHLGHIPRGQRGGVSLADQILVHQVRHVLRSVALEHRRPGQWRARAAMASALLAAFEDLWRRQPNDLLLHLQQRNADLPAAFAFRTIDAQSSTLQQVQYCLEATSHMHKLNPTQAAEQLGELAHIISSELTDPLGSGFERAAEAVEVDRTDADTLILKRFVDLANKSKMGQRAEQTYAGKDTMARKRWRTRMSRNVEYFGWISKVTAEASQREAGRPVMTNRERLAESLVRAEAYLEQRR